jgi:hypothetical protein
LHIIFDLLLRNAGICLLTAITLSAEAVDEVYFKSLIILGI